VSGVSAVGASGRAGEPASVLRRAEAWLFTPAPAERLAVLRLLAGSFSVAYLLIRLPAFLALADAPARSFHPVGLFSPLAGPWSATTVRVLVLATIALGVAFTVGLWFRVTGPVFAVGLLLLCTYRSSWGQLLHFENLMVLQVLIIGFAASADALALGPARRRHGRPPVDAAYGWPVRLAALVTVLTYALAGVAKLRLGGLQWMVGDTLRNHVAYSAARLDLLGGTPSPLGRRLVAQAWVFPPLATATVLVELAAPVALLGGRLRNAWVVAAWLLHAGVAALMFVVFPYPLFLVAFAPFFRLERLTGGVQATAVRNSLQRSRSTKP
jgi:HTTM domain